MTFQLAKDNNIIPQVLTQILDGCVNGITLSDPDQPDSPIVYANSAFEKITGYSKNEIIGHNCRFLQGDDREQPELDQIRSALKHHQPIEVVLRNYRKGGELFYNRLSITPLFDNEGNLIYYMGVQYDITKQINAEKEIERLNEKLQVLN